jgi:hypothetical protein
LAGTSTSDPRTLHTGTSVAKGEKWAVNKWVRERRIRLDYEREADPDAVHLGMRRAELVELIAEMSLGETVACMDVHEEEVTA